MIANTIADRHSVDLVAIETTSFDLETIWEIWYQGAGQLLQCYYTDAIDFHDAVKISGLDPYSIFDAFFFDVDARDFLPVLPCTIQDLKKVEFSGDLK
jgi:hypothetical protein